MIKMRIKGKLYTGQSVYDCLCQAVRHPINIHAKMVDVHKLISKQPKLKNFIANKLIKNNLLQKRIFY